MIYGQKTVDSLQDLRRRRKLQQAGCIKTASGSGRGRDSFVYTDKKKMSMSEPDINLQQIPEVILSLEFGNISNKFIINCKKKQPKIC